MLQDCITCVPQPYLPAHQVILPASHAFCCYLFSPRLSSGQSLSCDARGCLECATPPRVQEPRWTGTCCKCPAPHVWAPLAPPLYSPTTATQWNLFFHRPLCWATAWILIHYLLARLYRSTSRTMVANACESCDLDVLFKLELQAPDVTHERQIDQEFVWFGWYMAHNR